MNKPPVMQPKDATLEDWEGYETLPSKYRALILREIELKHDRVKRGGKR